MGQGALQGGVQWTATGGFNHCNSAQVTFDFLGYTFKPRQATGPRGVRKRSDKTLQEIAKFCNPRIIRGWMNYYGKYYESALDVVLQRLNGALINWARRTLKRLKREVVRIRAV